MLPIGAKTILDARLKGRRPADQIVVSFVGSVDWSNPQVHAEPGREYDWRFLQGLPVMVLVKPGIGVRSALSAIFREAQLYPTLVDLERRKAASIIDNKPLRLSALTDRWPGVAELFAA